MIAQPEGGCNLDDPRNWRTRTSIHVEMGGHHIQVDAAPEFRIQCINCGIRKVDTFIPTHPHADHILGMDDLRRFAICVVVWHFLFIVVSMDCSESLRSTLMRLQIAHA